MDLDRVCCFPTLVCSLSTLGVLGFVLLILAGGVVASMIANYRKLKTAVDV